MKRHTLLENFLTKNKIRYEQRLSIGFVCSCCRSEYYQGARFQQPSKVYLFSLFPFFGIEYLSFLKNKKIEQTAIEAHKKLGFNDTKYLLSVCEECFGSVGTLFYQKI